MKHLYDFIFRKESQIQDHKVERATCVPASKSLLEYAKKQNRGGTYLIQTESRNSN